MIVSKNVKSSEKLLYALLITEMSSVFQKSCNPSVTRIEEASEPVTQGFSPDLSALKG